MKLCFVTHNDNKLREIAKHLPEHIQLISLNDLAFDEEIEETGNTIEENSLLKAEVIYKKFGIPVFADDTGLEVEALNGEPGVFSARYAGVPSNNTKNIELLLQNLTGIENRAARFKTVITLIIEGKPIQFTGIATGKILAHLRGTEGFGYDPIFLPEGHQQTFAEMSMEQKNSISHRGKAVNQLISYLSKHGI